MAEYGTVAVFKLAGTFAEWEAAIGALTPSEGYLRGDTMLCDDGVTVVLTVFYESEALYRKNAESAEMASFYSKNMAPLIAGDVKWHDGHWSSSGAS